MTETDAVFIWDVNIVHPGDGGATVRRDTTHTVDSAQHPFNDVIDLPASAVKMEVEPGSDK